MKRIIFVFFFLPLLLNAQKIKVNEFDKFIKQKRIETFPLTLLSAAKNKMAVTLSSVGPALYLQLSGAGIGAHRIDENDKVIFLFSNDSTVTIYSRGYQNFDIGMDVNSYMHNYKLSPADLLKLNKYQLQALRKYHGDQFDDIYISEGASNQFKQLTALFIQELSKEDLLPSAKAIVATDVSRHMGDSVTFVGRIVGSRYLLENQVPTNLLDIGNTAPNELASLYLNEGAKAELGNPPPHFFDGKTARISGRVTSVNGKPLIHIYSKEQLVLLQEAGPVANANTVPANPVNNTNTAGTVKKGSAPAFPGGYQVWMDFLSRNLKPPVEMGVGEKKTVVVQFMVTADGSVQNIKVVESAGDAFDKEVLRVLARMPKWKAAIEGGNKVNAIVTQPVTFHGVSSATKKPF